MDEDTELEWQETGHGLSAATLLDGFRYHVVSTSDGQVSWQSPYDEGEWRHVASTDAAKQAAATDYAAHLPSLRALPSP